MRKTMLLSGYLFQWYMKKGGWLIYGLTMGIGILSAVAVAFGGLFGENNVYLAKGFLPYEIIVDCSWIPICFLVGILLLALHLFWQMRKYRMGGKGIYTFYTLPMEGKQTAASFLLTTGAILFFYYALWLILILVMYFPLMKAMVSLAAQQEFLMADGSIVTGLDATRHNGLFLAFVRSGFLRMFYSVQWQVLLSVMMTLALLAALSCYSALQENIGVFVLLVFYAVGSMVYYGADSSALFFMDGWSGGRRSVDTSLFLAVSVLFLLWTIWNIVTLCRRFEKPRAK